MEKPKVVAVTETSEIYKKYPGQTSPQDVYIYWDTARNRLDCSYNAEIGNAVPMRVWEKKDLRWAIPLLKIGACNRLMNEIATAIAVTPEAASMSAIDEQVEELIGNLELDDSDDCLSVWDAGDYFALSNPADLGIKPSMTDREIATLADDLEEEALEHHEVDVLDGIERYIRREMEKMKEDE